MLDDLGVFADSEDNVWRALDISEPMAADYDDGDDLTQFALRFENDTDQDGETEFVQFNTEGVVFLYFLVP
jgi:hypothetical protein